MKEKRKTRLNKTQGTKTEFLGFGAFADTATSSNSQPASSSCSNKPQGGASLRWSPIYMGKDEALALLFTRLLKKDTTTRTKALQELQDFFRQDDIPKKQQVDALAHFLFLYHSKLTYDSSSTVRAEALVVLALAAARLPKAFSTLVKQNNQQVLGMMYCCHGDPAAEVRAVANKYVVVEEAEEENDDNRNTKAYTITDMQAGIWDYVERILSYGRASKMQEDLFATSLKSANSNISANSKGGGKGGKGNSSNTTSGELSENQKDLLEETFERVVGTALSGLQVWIQQHGLIGDRDIDELCQRLTTQPSPVLWKTLSSPKSSLRNRTYALLSTSCQNATAIILDPPGGNGFSQTLPQALASEKEPGNMTSLLEALLAFLAAHKKHPGNSPGLNAATVTKHLIKIFKKSCYGASAAQWGPTALPLLAMLPDQVEILTAVWKGKEHAIRLGDQIAVARTVSESAAFFLLKKNSEEEQNNHPRSKDLAELWLGCLKNFLETELPPKSGPVRQAQLQLGKAMAAELRQLESACYDRPTCAVYTISDWFWQEQLRPCILEAEGYAALAVLVQELRMPPKAETTASDRKRLSSILQEKFHKVLAAYQTRSGDVPTVDAYHVMIAILQVCGMGEEEEVNGGISMEKFLMSDVLRWMVIHTSSISVQKQTQALAKLDFQLFGICAANFSEEVYAQRFEAVLREVIAAKCRLSLLLAGLLALLESGIPVERVRCNLLDEFAIQVVKDAMEIGESHEEEKDNEVKSFLQTCAGLKGTPALVRQSVLQAWVDEACPSSGSDDAPVVANTVPGPILETLLVLSSNASSLQADEIHRIALRSWCQGGHEWDELAVELLLNDANHLSTVIAKSSTILRSALVAKSSKAGESNAQKGVELWSDMARRLMRLGKQEQGAMSLLELVALGDISLWQSSSSRDFLFCCLMNIFSEISTAERLELLQSCGAQNDIPFVVQLLMSLSEASIGGAGSIRAAQRKDHCAQLLAVLGGKTSLRRKTLESWLIAATSELRAFLQAQDLSGVPRAVALASQLCDLMVDRVKPRDVFNPEEDDAEDASEEFDRERIAKMIVPALNKESFSSTPWRSCAAELASVVFFQCGVGSERGIGSLHYDMFQLLQGSVGRLRALLSDHGDTTVETVVQELMLLSLSCGLGLNTPEADWNSQLMTFDAEQITASVLDYHGAHTSGETVSELDRAVFSWLITSDGALGNNSELRDRALVCLYNGAMSILGSGDSNGSDMDTLLALRGIQIAMVASRKYDSNVANLGVQTVMRVMEGFSLKWEHSIKQHGIIGQDFDENCHPISGIRPAWRSLSRFPDIVSSMVTRDQDLLTATCSEFADTFVEALTAEDKRWQAFRLLEALARSTQVLGDPTPDEATSRRLAQWTETMDTEEKDELEEDVEITSELLPHRLMTEIESWSDEEYSDSVHHEVIIGRMLAWLACLSFIDAFVRKDPSYRPSLCSYIDKSGGVDSILNLILLHTGVGTERSGKASSDVDLDALIRNEATVNKMELASLVLFRTVEALPTLSRKWWESECPKVYTGPIRDYIEAHIAPVILRSELERLKYATIKNVFGTMTVTGSVTTREITAIYVQDEIKLKVMIRLPSFFPLRNAEVDCSQTLGVSAKRWKLWSLQITMMLNNQGGTLQEALMLWKENVDKEFDGVEPCPVCYSVLHLKSHKLPELECTTCSNRFHTQCLTEWFKRSGKTQCVICQQPWAGTRVKK